MSIASRCGVSAKRSIPVARESASASDRVRAWGSVNAVPIATRSARRANGSALVWSRSTPSQPRAAALRTIDPTLAGLSTEEHLRLFSEQPTLPDKIRSEMEAWMKGRSFDGEITESDDVAGSILEIAEAHDADLLVIGARGQSGFEHFLTGSVADKLVRSSPVPVVTVK